MYVLSSSRRKLCDSAWFMSTKSYFTYVYISDLLSTSEIEQVTRKFTIPPRSSVTSQANTTAASGISIFAEDNSFSSTHADSAPSRDSCSPSSKDWSANHGRASSESPTPSSCSKSPRKTPRKCKLAVNFSVPFSK